MPKRVAVELQRSGGQSRPSLDSDMDQPLHKSDGGKFAVDGVDVLRAAVDVARVIAPDQRLDDGALVLLHQIPQVHVDRHAAGLDT